MSILNQQSTPLPPGFFDAQSGMVAMSLVSFPAGSFIELDDPMTGARRLAMVCDSGTEFVDCIDYDNPQTPLAILAVLSPVQWGDCRAIAADMLLSGGFDCYESFSGLLEALCNTPAGGDPLTLNRAAKWAHENWVLDVAQAARAGLDATAEARARRTELASLAAGMVAAGAV